MVCGIRPVGENDPAPCPVDADGGMLLVPKATSYVAAPAALHVSVGVSVTPAAASAGRGEPGAEGGAGGTIATATLSNVALAACEAVWLLTASPTSGVGPRLTGLDPMSVQVFPSTDW